MKSILIIEENAPVGLSQLPHEDVDEEVVTRYSQAVYVDLSIPVSIHGQFFGNF